MKQVWAITFGSNSGKHRVWNLCRTIRRHLETATEFSLISAGSRRSRVPGDNFRGRRTCCMYHVLSDNLPTPAAGGVEKTKEDGVKGSFLSLSLSDNLNRSAEKREAG